MFAHLFQSTTLMIVIALSMTTFAPLDARAGDIVKGAFGQASGAKTPASNASVIKLTYNVLVDQTEHPKAVLELMQALQILGMIAPEGVELVPTMDEVSNFAIEVTDDLTQVGNPKPHKFLTGYFDSISADVESSTFIPDGLPYGPYLVQLYWNRTIYEIAKQGLRRGHSVRRHDAFTRLVASLAREIYGSVLMAQTRPDILPLENIRHLRTNDFIQKDQLVFRRAAFEAGVEALKRFAALAHKLKLTPAAHQDIAFALAREERSLVAIQRDYDDLMIKQAEAMTAKTGEVKLVGSLQSARCERLFR